MASIISGKELSKSIKDKLKEEIVYYKRVYKRLPQLVVILVGDDPASESYVKGKEKASLEIGMLNKTIVLPKDISEEKYEVGGFRNANHGLDKFFVALEIAKRI